MPLAEPPPQEPETNVFEVLPLGDFRHMPGVSGEFYFPEIMGSGVGLIDYDGDGDLDIYLVQAADLPPEPGGHRNVLLENRLKPDGRLVLRNAGISSGLDHDGYGMGVATGDIDNDGDPDLYLTNFGPNVLYLNNGDGTFSDITPPGDAADQSWSTSASFLDYDLDGDLDLYVANYVGFTLAHNVRCAGHAGQRDYCDPKAYAPQRDRLWRNEGDGRFTDVTGPSGIGASLGNGLGVTAADFDGDGWPDIYLANDQMANFLWRNNGDGTFSETALMTGAAYNADGASEASMGVTAGDYDGDGDEDLFMTHLGAETNTIYRNDGSGGFVDVSDLAGLSAPSLGFTGFGAAWFDVDNDGLLDLFSANGAVQAEPAQVGNHPWPYRQTDQLFVNQGNGRFADVSRRSGAAFQEEHVGRGAAFGDIDNDGDIDIVVSNNNGPARLLINHADSPAWLRVRLRGSTANRDGTGARVAVLRGGEPLLWRRAHTDGSYLSASDPRVHFGLGEVAGVDGIRVEWPGGGREHWPVTATGVELSVVQGSGEPQP